MREIKIRICKVENLEKQTGIIPRDNWWHKARNGKIYVVKTKIKTIAFLYLRYAKIFVKCNNTEIVEV